jgi:hypothetical protein
MGIEVPLPWTIDTLTTTLASELFYHPPKPSLSILGVLGSAAIKQQASGLVNPMLLQLSRTFVYIATFLHTFGKYEAAKVPVEGLRTLLDYILYQITRELNSTLKPRRLAMFSQQQLKCLFLILLGLSMAATYSCVRF